MIGIGIGIGRKRKNWSRSIFPSMLFAMIDSPNKISLYWSNNGTLNYTGIKIERSNDNGVTYLVIATLEIVSLYIDSDCIADTAYKYRVRYYKGSKYSSYSNVLSVSTFVDIPALTPDSIIKASSLSSVDMSDISTIEDEMNNFDFVTSETNDICTLRNLPVKFVLSKNDLTSGLWTTLSGANRTSMSYFEMWFIVFARYNTTAITRILCGYRDSSQELFQVSINSADQRAYLQFRTNTGTTQSIANDFHAGRFNIIHVVIDKSNNIVTFEIDGVSNHLDYTFGSELLRSAHLTILNYSQSAALINGSLSASEFQFAEMIFAFNNNLSSKRTEIYNYFDNKYNLNLGSYTLKKTLAEIVAATPVVTDYLDRQDIYDLVTAGTIKLVEIQTTDTPQTIFDATQAGSLLRFKAGEHIHATNKNRSILYCDKPMYIELEAGATLKLADDSNTLDHVGEIVTNQGSAMVLNDFSIRGTYSGATAKDLCVRIDAAGATDTFKWGIGTWEPTYTTTGVAITGDWQTLAGTGIEIKFNATTGHALNNLWIVCFDGEESYGIRVGTGFHANYIKDVVIFGDGVIDLNYSKQVVSSIHAKDLPSCILVHGRCKDTIIEGIIIQNGDRPIMVYGDNDGTYGINGTVTGGTNYLCIGTKIINTKILNDFNTPEVKGAGILLGHPEHRGQNLGTIVVLNDVAAYWNGIEPNFMLNNFEIRNNKFRASDETYLPNHIDIRQWRECINGIIANNDAEVYPAVGNAPLGWQSAKNIYISNNARI